MRTFSFLAIISSAGDNPILNKKFTYTNSMPTSSNDTSDDDGELRVLVHVIENQSLSPQTTTITTTTNNNNKQESIHFILNELIPNLLRHSIKEQNEILEQLDTQVLCAFTKLSLSSDPNDGSTETARVSTSVSEDNNNNEIVTIPQTTIIEETGPSETNSSSTRSSSIPSTVTIQIPETISNNTTTIQVESCNNEEKPKPKSKPFFIEWIIWYLKVLFPSPKVFNYSIETPKSYVKKIFIEKFVCSILILIISNTTIIVILKHLDQRVYTSHSGWHLVH
jgi:hypothetical protein